MEEEIVLKKEMEKLDKENIKYIKGTLEELNEDFTELNSMSTSAKLCCKRLKCDVEVLEKESTAL